MRRLGSLYQRGQVWWIRYSLHRKEHRESSRSADKEAAVRLLARRMADGPLSRLSEDKIPFDDLAADYIQERELRGARGGHLQWSKARVANLKTYFGGMRAVDITTASLREYARKRLALDAAPGDDQPRLRRVVSDVHASPSGRKASASAAHSSLAGRPPAPGLP
jgi:hypothetical protein